jgi:hypothetical protein
LRPFLTLEYITDCRRGKREDRSEQGGKKRKEMRQKRKIQRLIEEGRKVNVIKGT